MLERAHPGEERMSGDRFARGAFLMGCSSIAILAGATASRAERADSRSPAADAASAAGTQVSEIIVTAEKRSERISNVGMAISAFTADTLKQQGVSSVADLASVVPGLTYAHSNTALPVYTLRGVGFYETSLAAYPAVTVYVDQAPLPFPLLTSHTVLALEQVEVLKGPQGILFGQNSTGGAINFIAAKPTDTLRMGVDATYGRFNRAKLEGFISGPLTDTLKARLSMSVERGDDWQQSYTRQDTLGKVRTYVGRLIVDWQPTDRLSFEANINGWVDKSDPQAAQFYKLDLQLPSFASAALRNYPVAPADPRAADWGPRRPMGDQDMVQASLRGELRLTPDATLTSLTSYVVGHRDDLLDPDGMALDGYGLLATGTIRSFFQELRVTNSGADRLRYTVGGNFERSTVFDNGTLSYVDSTIADAYHFAHNGLLSDQKITSEAAFANVDFDVTRKLTFKAGARYTKTDRHDSGCTYDPGDGQIAAFFTYLSSLVRGSPTPAIKPLGCTNLNASYLPVLFVDDLNESNLSWRVGADYKPADRVLLYVNVAKGYKAGSFPNAAASTTAQFAPVVQESVLDYEAGFKVAAFDRRVSLDGAAFYYDYTNKQLRSKLIDPVFGVLDALVNIPKSSVKGAELSVNVNPGSGLQGDVAVTYLDATVDKFVGINGAGVSADFSHTAMPFAPKLSLSAAASYEWLVSPDWMASVGGDVSHNSSTFSVVGQDPDSRISSFTLLDLRAGLRAVSNRWRVELWAKNVTNAYYWTNAIVVYDQRVRYAGMPRTFGVTLSYRY